jgi:hypothetical protein
MDLPIETVGVVSIAKAYLPNDLTLAVNTFSISCIIAYPTTFTNICYKYFFLLTVYLLLSMVIVKLEWTELSHHEDIRFRL